MQRFSTRPGYTETGCADCLPGASYPLGATMVPGGVNFVLYSRTALAVDLLFFDHVDAPVPSRIVSLDRKVNRTFHYWHIMVPGIEAGQLYGYRCYGPMEPEKGLRFDMEKVLLDPYGRLIATPSRYSRSAAIDPGDNSAQAMKSVVVDLSAYDWEDDAPLRHLFNRSVIYELHVRGFTRHPSSGIGQDARGTYRGLIEKIPYLKELGITAVELMPIFHFDREDAPEGKINYWGYSPVSFFAPHTDYAASENLLGVVDEFRDMVKALHRADIEVILDVVYNHTAEGNEDGPTFCWRGIDNEMYYILEGDRTRYANYSGTGNTLNTNHPIVRRMILDSLRFWVEEMHVDGFRFDLASILSRGLGGDPWPNPPIVLDIDTDPVLAGVKLIAEAWDAAGLYQVGQFGGDHWKEWNGRYRDDVRAFIKGDEGLTGAIASRFLASPDLYGHDMAGPEQSINFVTCHDGFTLNDLVSYNEKHNEANGEDNRDGHNHNLSWNCGVEGPTDDPAIEALRNRQVKNFLTMLLMSLGVPMLLMGDEMRRTQWGNNNAYGQDNEISWLDWSLLERHSDIHRFTKLLIGLRRELDIFQGDFDLSLNEMLQNARIQWHGVELYRPDWSNDARSIAFTVRGIGGRRYFHAILNAWWEEQRFALPPKPAGSEGWRCVVDTALPSPDDFRELQDAPLIRGARYRVKPRSVALFIAQARSSFSRW
ncbi:MAG: glycogen debranching protein GlgX [Caldilineaceae bacterium]|nr:glycogen debranching protein GlgX [Caldilineaceae bacterium]